MTDRNRIVARLNAYAEISDMLGAYTEANCIYDAIEEIERLRKQRNELVKMLEEEYKAEYPEYLLQYPHNQKKLEGLLESLKEYKE